MVGTSIPKKLSQITKCPKHGGLPVFDHMNKCSVHLGKHFFKFTANDTADGATSSHSGQPDGQMHCLRLSAAVDP